MLKNKNLIYYILFISLILKFSLLFILGAESFLDGKWYMKVAEEIFNNHFLYPNDELNDAPITPYFYALFYPFTKYIGISAFAVGNIIVATATIYLLYKISLLIFKNEIIANITAIITLIYPFFNFYSIAILTETIYIFFLYLSLFFAIKFYDSMKLKYIYLFSFFFAIDTLIRFANLAMFPFFIFLFSIFAIKKRETLLFMTKVLSIASITFILTMSLWWIRNYNVFGEFVATSKGESGKVFYAGNNPLNKTGGGIVSKDGENDYDLSQFKHIKDPIKKDIAMRDAAIKWIKENPRDWIILEYKKFIRFFRITLYAPQYQTWYYKLISIMSYGVILLLFIYGLFKFKNYFWNYSPLLLYAILLTGVHMVFIASVRYRLPIEPFMIIIASATIFSFIQKFKKGNV